MLLIALFMVLANALRPLQMLATMLWGACNAGADQAYNLCLNQCAINRANCYSFVESVQGVINPVCLIP